MATLSLNVEKARSTADGSIPVRIKITSKNTKAYIATRYKVDGIKYWNGTTVVKTSWFAIPIVFPPYHVRKKSPGIRKL